MNSHRNNLIRDFSIIVLSVLIAVILVKTGVFRSILVSTQEAKFLGNFIAGILFVSVFTAAPAATALGEIARANSPIVTAIIGGLGALAGDLIIFRFVRDGISRDISYLVKMSKSERIISIFKLKLFKWLIPFIGALIVASPLPDELGLVMLGLSRMKISTFIPLSFLLNSIGILIIGLIARAL